MGVIRFICGFRENVICCYLRTAVRFREPTKELRIFACRLSRQHQLFAIGLICGFRFASTKIPCHDVFVCFKLRIKRCAGCDRGDSVVELAACFGRVPALKAVPLFDGERCGNRRLAIRLDGFAVCCLPVDQTAIRTCIPCNRQRNSSPAVIAFPIVVGIYMVSVFIARISASRARLGALMLRFAVRNPRAVAIRMVSIVIGRRTAAGAGLCTPVLGITVLAPRACRIAVTAILCCGVPAGAAGGRTAVLTGRRIAPGTIAHAVAGIIIIRCTAVPARTGAPVLTGGILLPRAIAIAVTAGIDGFALGLATSTAIITVSITGASCGLLTL